ncbi:M56 family metallopeptidase [Flavobacterium sp. ABG]|uniref:M56 family metallopeptidase n=1 Tax=Flavobacterium sp. ABG TaxID=1423322 RepID=UPI00064B0203|nr:M56 family metallopeptidase [Flavobacterium sp. ABG]KLT67881.1 peptidase M56 [Flavobacterium sp. ABG]
MEALFIFIAKSSALVALFYLAYYLLLRKETFFTSNRWFLLAGLITSVVLPFIVYTKIVWIDPVPVSNMSYSPASIVHAIEEESFEINWNLVYIAIYTIGFIAFLVKFGLDFYSLNAVLKGKKVQQQADFKFIDTNENIAPFSYFDYIVYNSSLYTASELESIIEHEKVHSDQHHTVDVLISRLFCVLFWFNPIIWFYKKAIIQNLEFIADNEAAKKLSDKKAYQYTLLKITTHETCVAITNHFYQSLIKKRIVMLNKNQSKKRNYWKYYAILPALVAFVVLFQIKTVAQEKKQIEAVAKEKEQSVEIYKIKKNTTDQELKELSEKLKANHDVDVVVSEVKRNSKNELTCIKVALKKGAGEAQTIQINGDEAIKDCGIAITTNDNGTKKIKLIADGQLDGLTDEEGPAQVRETRTVYQNGAYTTPPTPPTPPVFPAGAMPSPPTAMANMPKPPVPPANLNDKTAMKNYEREMDEFEKKMDAFEPQMAAYEKELNEVMSKREAIFEKEMEKYEVAMEQFNADMGKYDQQSNVDMKQHEIDMKQHEKDMRQHEKDMKQYERDMRQQERDMRLQQRAMIQQQKNMAKKQH